jgi:stress-induced morphogen
MTPGALKERLVRAFPDAEVEIVDLTGTEDHYEVRISSSAFAGKSRIAQHKLVYEALGESVGGAIHALALKTKPRS